MDLKKTDGLLPLGIVNETICELNGPIYVPLLIVKLVAGGVGPTTLVIPSGAKLTVYALVESVNLGGKSYFKFWGNPIDEVGKFKFYIII